MGIYIQCFDDEGCGCEISAVKADSKEEAEELFFKKTLEQFTNPTEEDVEEAKELYEARKDEGYIKVVELPLCKNTVQVIWSNL